MILSITDGRIERVTTSDFVGMYTYESAEKMPQIVRDAMLKTGRMHPDFPIQVALHGFNHLDSSDGYFLPGKTDGIGGGTNTHVLSNTTLLIEGIWGCKPGAAPSEIVKKWLNRLPSEHDRLD